MGPTEGALLALAGARSVALPRPENGAFDAAPSTTTFAGDVVSSTNRGAPREPRDFYATPAWCVRRLLERIAFPRNRWLDPCAGSGAIIRAAKTIRDDVNWAAVEIRTHEDDALRSLVGPQRAMTNYLSLEVPLNLHDVIVANPPYSLAQEFLEKALREAQYVAFLLRLNYLGSGKRAAFFQRNPPDVYVLPNRPSFVRGQTDSCEYGWFVWGPERNRAHGNVSVLATTPRRERQLDTPSAPQAHQLAVF